MPGVVAPVRHLIAPPEDALDVDIAHHRTCGTGSEPGRSEHLDGSQERLRRKARVVRALSARQLALDDRDLDVVVEPAQRTNEVLAARTGSEYDDLCDRCHAPPRLLQTEETP